MNRSIVVACAVLCTQIAAQAQESSGLRPYLRADIGVGRFLEIEEDEEAPEEFDAVTDGLKKATEFSVAAGILNSEGRYGLGLFYLRDASEGTLSKSFSLEGGSVTRIDATLVSQLFGLQGIVIAPLGPVVDFRGEVGLAKASGTQEIDMDMMVQTGSGLIPASGLTTLEFDGVAFTTGLGLDFKLNAHFAIGGMARLVRGNLTPSNGNIVVSVQGQSQEQKMDMDDQEDADISSVSLSACLRLTM